MASTSSLTSSNAGSLKPLKIPPMDPSRNRIMSAPLTTINEGSFSNPPTDTENSNYPIRIVRINSVPTSRPSRSFLDNSGKESKKTPV